MTAPGASLNWAYCTNGFSGHRLPQALEVLAELGYTGAVITLDHGHLDPYAPGLAGEVAAIGKLLRGRGRAGTARPRGARRGPAIDRLPEEGV